MTERLSRPREDAPLDVPLADEQRALATVCAHFIGVFMLAFGLVRWSALLPGDPLTFLVTDQVALLALAAALMVGTSARSGLLTPATCLALGPWTLVGGAAAIHVIELTVPWPADAITARISWVCLWIVGFPLAGPRLPRGWPPLVAAATGPTVLLVGAAVGAFVSPSLQQAIVGYAPQFIAAAAIAVPVERLLTQKSDDRMGSYRLLRQVGLGGMGEVWTAEHRLLAFPAAIKLIRSEAMQKTVDGSEAKDVEARFRQEARATATLQSPHTVRLFDFGVTEDRRLFYVMELLEGVDLLTFVRRFGPLQPDRVVKVLQQACLSLAEAHEQGLVHRDIKPSNLFVCRLGVQVDYVKVLDFGLVSDALTFSRPSGPMTTETGLSVAGTILGTPAFISPEVCLGKEVDRRADIYALGCVAVWLLTGRLLFDGSLAEILRGHAQEPPRLQPTDDVAIDPALEKVVLACLAKDPSDRPQTAMELYDLLGTCDHGTWDEPRSRAWWATHLPKGSGPTSN